jgi:hypothetical protein
MLVGLPKLTLSQMVDPRSGVAASNEFFSLAAVKKWLDQNGPQPKFNPIPQQLIEHVEPEERARRVEMLKGVARQIRNVTKTKVVGRPAVQSHNPNKLMAALENLEAINGESQ